VLRQERGHSAEKSSWNFPTSRGHLEEMLQKIGTDGTMKKKHGSGWNLEADGQPK